MSNLDAFFDDEPKKEIRIPGQWYRRGKAYYRFDPEAEQLIADHYKNLEEKYIMACFLYYHAPVDKHFESPLPDEEFDQIQESLQVSTEYLTDYFKSKTDINDLKGSGHAMKFTDEEKQKARDWYEEHKKNKRNSSI